MVSRKTWSSILLRSFVSVIGSYLSDSSERPCQLRRCLSAQQIFSSNGLRYEPIVELISFVRLVLAMYNHWLLYAWLFSFFSCSRQEDQETYVPKDVCVRLGTSNVNLGHFEKSKMSLLVLANVKESEAVKLPACAPSLFHVC